jgi:hypothetical protein
MSIVKIEIRKHQLVNKQGQNVLIDCVNNQGSYILGNVDSTWIDITAETDGLEDLELYIKKPVNSGKASERSATAQVTLVGGAQTIVMDWLYSTACSQLNYFDVRITDLTCNLVYNMFSLKADNIEYCTNDGCGVTLPLREADNQYFKLKKISIMDNHLKWFSEDGTKEHPTFLVTILNQMSLLQSVSVGMYLFVQNLPGIGLIIDAIADIEKAIRKSLGVGYYAPAPLIRTLLENVAIKAGLTLDTIFDVGQDAENDCMFIPYGGDYHHNESVNGSGSPSTKFIWGNRYIWSADKFIEALCKTYNCYWEIGNGVLYIKKNIELLDSQTFDLSQDIIGNVCYSYNLEKKPSYGKYEYASDASDMSLNSSAIAYNDIVDFDGEADNPILEGELDKRFEFANTSFLHDSFSTNPYIEIFDTAYIVAYILAGLLSFVATSLIAGTITATGAVLITAGVAYFTASISISVADKKNEYGENSVYGGSIRIMGNGSINTPKIIRYDPENTSIGNAKAVYANIEDIQPSWMNTENIAYEDQPWGSSLKKPFTKVWNYPLYFDANYIGNMYDKYHEQTDNPFKVNVGNKTLTLIMPLCCETIVTTGLVSDIGRIVGKVAKVSDTEKIIVEEVKVSYKEMLIEVKGKIIYI